MELKELKKKSENDLQKLLAEYRENLRALRFKDANKQLKNIREIREIKKVIARILTLLNKDRKEISSKVKEETVKEKNK